MKSPGLVARTLVVAGLLVGAAVFVFFAIMAPVGGVTPGLRAWNIKFLLAIVAAGFVAFATMVSIQAMRRRSDSRFAASHESELVVPVYVWPLTRTQIQSALPDASPVRLPTRTRLVVNRTGIEFWGHPTSQLVSVPWSDISTTVPTEMVTSGRRVAGIAIQLAGEERKVEVVLVGTGLLAIPNREQAVEVAAKIRALRP